MLLGSLPSGFGSHRPYWYSLLAEQANHYKYKPTYLMRSSLFFKKNTSFLLVFCWSTQHGSSWHRRTPHPPKSVSGGRKEGDQPGNAPSFLTPLVSPQCPGISFPHFSFATIPEEGEETLETPEEEKKEPRVPELPREEEAGKEAVLVPQWRAPRWPRARLGSAQNTKAKDTGRRGRVTGLWGQHHCSDRSPTRAAKQGKRSAR